MISFRKILFIIGVNFLLLSVPMYITSFIGFIYREHDQTSNFFWFASVLVFLGWIIIKNTKKFIYNKGSNQQIINIKEGYIITLTTWIALCLLGAIPFYYFVEGGIFSIGDAIFESTSGLTTTGSTILQDIESLPTTIKFYRQFLQWIGGFGIIILAVAILPMLGIGSSSLFSSEKLYSYGSSKVSPKIKDTAMQLFKLYVLITIFCTLGYFYSGMNFFDALTHSFSTVSLGGFSTYNDNFMHFSFITQVVCVIFLFIASINFVLHYYALREGNALKTYFKNIEFRAFLYIILVITIISTVAMVFGTKDYSKTGFYLFHSLFSTLSLTSSAGFISTDFFNWGFGIPSLILCVSFVGGCTGSTSGGIKVIRFMILFKQINLEFKKLINPHANYLVKADDVEVKSKAVLSVIAFFALFILSFFACIFLLTLSGADFTDAFYAVAACLTNAGQSIGNVSSNFGFFSEFQKSVLSFSMLLGRLELFAVLMLFTPQFWRY